MIRITLTGTERAMNALKRRSQQLIQQISQDVLVTVKKYTPIRKGTARRAWHLQRQNRGISVINRTPYINRLDEGYSTQAPNGIIAPTLNEITKRRYK